MRQYFVYILSSRSRTLYVGVTRDLQRRLWQHRNGELGFTAKYRVCRLVYWEMITEINVAIRREKQIKGYRRSKKLTLIARMNPAWNDLSESLGLNEDSSMRSGKSGTSDSSLRSE